jgi:TPR repeat protein
MKQDELKYPSREEIEQWMREAEAGDAEAQYQLGICYANGYGVTIDQITAVEYFFDASEQNHPQALYQLGNCYLYGYGVYCNYRTAADCFEQAAKLGVVRAQYRLGNCYYYGNGVDTNYKQAKYWYAKAADQGDADALYGLSMCRFDEEESFAWCEKSAEQGCAEAQYQLGMYYEYGDVVRASFNKALDLYTLAAEQGHEEAKECKERMEEEREQAALWIHEAEQGDPEVLDILARCYEKGIGMEHDYESAKEYYTRAYKSEIREDATDHLLDERFYQARMARLDKLIQVERWEEMAERGDVNAMVQLSKYYEYDALYEEELKPKRAIYWLRKAADSGNALAQVLLGSHYELGNVVLKDNDEAFRLYSLAAEQGDAWGQYEVGHCYERGIGVGENMEEAIRYYTLSAAQGGVDARNALHRIKDWYGFPGHENPVYVSLAQAALENLKKENRE